MALLSTERKHPEVFVQFFTTGSHRGVSQLISPRTFLLWPLFHPALPSHPSLLKIEGIFLERGRSPYSAPILAPALSVSCFVVTLVGLMEVSDPAGGV